jgi:hypothetical protein
VRSLALVALVVLASSTPALAERAERPRYLISPQLALGAAALDGTEFAQSWSLAGGLRVLPGIYTLVRLRQTSTFEGSLAEDLVVGWVSDGQSHNHATGEDRTHETGLDVGLRGSTRWVWAELTAGGAFRYQVNGTGFHNRGLFTLDGTLGVPLTGATSGDSARLAVFGNASFDAATGAFNRAIFGLEVTLELL